MSAQTKAAAQLILERMAIPGRTDVYVLGSFASPVTFSSQQARAFNLIWALVNADKLSAGDSVAVVGAGLAGITAAAAAVLKQCRVSLFEKASQPLYLQRGNFTRHVHPNILKWPAEDSNIAETKFPTLNWHAGIVDDVVAQIEAQWAQLSERVEKHFGYEVDTITHAGGSPSVKANRIYGNGPTILDQEFKCVILAVGFGLEKTLPKVSFRSYWDNDGLHRELPPAQKIRRFLISGCGDGGLIDSLRLRIRNFKHEDFVSEFFSTEDMRPAEQCLLEIEEEFSGKADDYDTSQQLYKAYKERVPLPVSLRERITQRLRPDTQVTINSPNPNPVSLRSSILNRFATFLLTEYGDLHYAEGRLAVKAGKGEYAVTFSKQDSTSHSKTFDEIIVRHGPDPAVNRLLPEDTIELLRKMWGAFTDPTVQPMWDDNFFPHSTAEALISSTSVIDLAVQQFYGAFPLLYDPRYVKQVGVGSFGTTGGYVVTLKQGHDSPESQKRKFLGGIPVKYHEEDLKTVAPTHQLEIGTAIYNYDRAEQGKADIKIIGTLGCFVILRTGEVAILSTSLILAGAGHAAVGDRIAHLNHGDTGEDAIIATLHAFTPISEESQDQLDAAVAILSPGVTYSPSFPAEYAVPALLGTGEVSTGDRVFKIGRSTGLTYGTVVGISEDIRVRYGIKMYDFEDTLAINSDEGGRFLSPGDSGALVVRTDGTVIGLVFASGAGTAFAFPIKRVLEALDCELLLPTQHQLSP